MRMAPLRLRPLGMSLQYISARAAQNWDGRFARARAVRATGLCRRNNLTGDARLKSLRNA